MVGHIHGHALEPGIPLEEVLAEHEPECFGLPHTVPPRDRIDSVLHRVGGQHVAIVAAGVRLGVLSLETYRYSEIAQIVTVAAAVEPYYPNPRFAVCGLDQHADTLHHP